MKRNRSSKARPGIFLLSLGGLVLLIGLVFLPHLYATTYVRGGETDTKKENREPVLDTAAYDAKMRALAHVDVASTTASSTPGLWPVEAPYPKPGAILPFNRIVAYYGNFYSRNMGVLGEYPKDEMLAKLRAEKVVWEAADPTTPVVMAINYIAVTAQEHAQADGKYRLRMPDSQIDYALSLANEIDGIVILDVQVGLSTLQEELPELEKYLALPNVHLGLDPEFSMKSGDPPGTVIGTFSAADINYAATYLQSLVQKHNLPPKVMIVHRFTQNMVTGYQNIQPLPEVQIVIDMDGWGFGAKKINTYNTVVYPEPVQFTGFKLFYKNDLKPPSTRLLTPQEILDLTPSPSFIQYQ
ncbi:MAG TPA: hypothetical protein VEB18_00450 [Candidatus Paceibacterota bacterium]|nr:hypothetical protein [Candidatus Paceibacterota bacterium]